MSKPNINIREDPPEDPEPEEPWDEACEEGAEAEEEEEPEQDECCEDEPVEPSGSKEKPKAKKMVGTVTGEPLVRLRTKTISESLQMKTPVREKPAVASPSVDSSVDSSFLGYRMCLECFPEGLQIKHLKSNHPRPFD